MNKVVPIILTMSALLFAAGCSSSDSRSSSHSGVSATHASYVTQGQAVCAACGTGQHSVGHAHSNQSGNAMRHSHAGGSGHSHDGYSAGYGYTTATSNAVVNAGRNTFVNTGVSTAAASSGGAGMSSLVKIAGALVVGGLIYNAVKDDDDDNNDVSTDCVSDPDPDKNTC